MRIRVVALVVLAALVAVGLASAMTVPKLKGSITSSSTISLKNSKGKTVKLLKAGKYTFVVKDTASIHNFTLDGPGINDKTITGTSFTGTKSATVKLKKGTYEYYCTVHPDINGKFKVS
jgi:plastocyanin